MNNHKEEYSSWLKGAERAAAKQDLLKTTPQNYRNQEIKKDNKDLFLSEFGRDYENHKHQKDRYIQFPDCRTIVYLFSKKSKKTLLKRGERITIHFDVTGSVVTNLN